MRLRPSTGWCATPLSWSLTSPCQGRRKTVPLGLSTSGGTSPAPSCPQGNEPTVLGPHRLQAFRFDGAVCQGCLLRSQCFTARRKGPGVITPLAAGGRLQQSADYNHYRQRRVVAEHRLARLEQLGIRQARYFGRVKTRFQLYLAATVANLTLLANQTGVFGDAGLGSPTLALSLSTTRAFRPAF